MIQYDSGVVCGCGGCGHRWPLVIETPDLTRPPDLDQFWPLVFDALDATTCPKCGSKRFSGSMHFVEPKNPAKAEGSS